MIHYKLRSTKDSLIKIFYNHLDNVCFCIDTKNSTVSGVCDVVAIPGSDEVRKILKDHFVLIKIEYNEIEYNEFTPSYYDSETVGNLLLL